MAIEEMLLGVICKDRGCVILLAICQVCCRLCSTFTTYKVSGSSYYLLHCDLGCLPDVMHLWLSWLIVEFVDGDQFRVYVAVPNLVYHLHRARISLVLSGNYLGYISSHLSDLIYLIT